MYMDVKGSLNSKSKICMLINHQKQGITLNTANTLPHHNSMHQKQISL